MQLSSLINYRTSFLFVGLLFFAGAVMPLPSNNLRLTGSHRQLINEFVSTPSPSPAVSAGDFSISANPTSLTIPIQNPGNTTGGVADGTLTLTGVNGFAGNVNLNCSVTGGTGQNVPTCFFPAAFPADVLFVDASEPASTTTIEADTVAGQCNPPEFCAVPNIFFGGPGIFAAALLVLVLLSISICVPGFFSRKLRAKVLRVAFMCMIGLVMVGCSNGLAGDVANGCPPGLAFTPGTPAGTYMLTVVATSGSLTHSVTISVIIPAQ